MKPPPAIPVEWKLTTPVQMRDAIALSTAWPPFCKISRPIYAIEVSVFEFNDENINQDFQK